MKVPSSSARRAPVTRVSRVSTAPWDGGDLHAGRATGLRAGALDEVAQHRVGLGARAATYAAISGWNHGGVCFEVISAR